MSFYDPASIGTLLSANAYPGRGILVGKSADGKQAVSAYFIMGRSANSRNRIFRQEPDGRIITAAFDESLVEDPTLIIYTAAQEYKNRLVVTNGDQTTTVCRYLQEGKTFEDALFSRAFEHDAPHFTPRISTMLTFANGGFTYQMSVLKSGDNLGKSCNRYFFHYQPLDGIGHFVHTYNGDGTPLPSFSGEPERVAIYGSIDDFTGEVWSNLNQDNKISLFVRFDDLATGKKEIRILNKNQ